MKRLHTRALLRRELVLSRINDLPIDPPGVPHIRSRIERMVGPQARPDRDNAGSG